MRALGHIVGWFTAAMVVFNAALYGARARVLRRLEACDAVDPLGTADAVWAFAMECAATAAVVLAIPFGWIMPRCREGAGTRGPIVLIHGWSVNRGCFWLLRRRLLRDGWGPVCCFDYRSLAFNVEAAAAQLRQVVDQLVHATGASQPLTLIGHSLGGLVARYYARRYPAAAVRRLVTLGTPHGGTALATPRAYGHSLVPGSPWLTTLAAADRVPQQFDVIVIHSTFDAMVLPSCHAEYTGAFNIRISDVGHNALLFSSKVYALIAENLRAPFSR